MKKARISLLFVVVLHICLASVSLFADDPISHWTFDEGTGTTAYDSAGDNDGTLVGDPVWTSGQIDGALDFDGFDDYVDLGNDSSLKPPLPVTLSAWIMFSQNNATLISLDDCSDKYYGVTLNITGENLLSVGFGDGSGWGSPAYRRSKWGTTALNEDTWYHVAAVARGATDMSIYINGVDDGGSYSGTGGSLAYSSGNASIATAHSAGIYFDGKIDDVRVYDRALSAEEVQDLYAEGAGPIAHWKLDEGEGDIAYDSEGDNDGTIYGAQWTTGIIDGALDFDGFDDYVDLGNDNSLKPDLPVTLCAWVSFSQNGRTIIGLDDSSSAYYGLWMDINVENHQTVAFGDGTGWGSSSYRRGKYGTTALSPDVWYHVVGVARGATDMSIYINGVDDGGTYSGSGGSLAYSSGNATIATSHYHDLYFEGKIDDVRIYDRALSAEEILELYLPPLAVAVDIKPGSCPNPLNVTSKGVLPVAILGTDDFDVNSIDAVSILLAGVDPIRSAYEDVAEPVPDGNECECAEEGPDGYTDLTLKFKTPEIVEALINLYGEPVDGDVLVLPLTGVLSDGTPIEGADCVRIVGKVPRSLAAKKSDVNEDGIVNILDFSMMAEYWLESAETCY